MHTQTTRKQDTPKEERTMPNELHPDEIRYNAVS